MANIFHFLLLHFLKRFMILKPNSTGFENFSFTKLLLLILEFQDTWALRVSPPCIMFHIRTLIFVTELQQTQNRPYRILGVGRGLVGYYVAAIEEIENNCVLRQVMTTAPCFTDGSNEVFNEGYIQHSLLLFCSNCNCHVVYICCIFPGVLIKAFFFKELGY